MRTPRRESAIRRSRVIELTPNPEPSRDNKSTQELVIFSIKDALLDCVTSAESEGDAGSAIAARSIALRWQLGNGLPPVPNIVRARVKDDMRRHRRSELWIPASRSTADWLRFGLSPQSSVVKLDPRMKKGLVEAQRQGLPNDIGIQHAANLMLLFPDVWQQEERRLAEKSDTLLSHLDWQWTNHFADIKQQIYPDVMRLLQSGSIYRLVGGRPERHPDWSKIKDVAIAALQKNMAELNSVSGPSLNTTEERNRFNQRMWEGLAFDVMFAEKVSLTDVGSFQITSEKFSVADTSELPPRNKI